MGSRDAPSSVNYLSARPPVLFAIVISLAMVVVGCGGASNSASGTSVLSKSEFVKQANTACERERMGLMKRVSDFEQRSAPGRPSPGADAVHYVFLPTIEEQMWRIEEIGVPRGENEKIEAMFDAVQFAVDEVAVMPRIRSIAVAERNFTEANRLFRAYGLYSCATASRP